MLILFALACFSRLHFNKKIPPVTRPLSTNRTVRLTVRKLLFVMSQADIDAFVMCAYWRKTLTLKGVRTAVARGIFVNGRHSSDGWTALHRVVLNKRPELVVALLEAGADPNVKNRFGNTSVLWGASDSNAQILQLLIDSGGSVNEPDDNGMTPLIAVVRWKDGDAAARLKVLLACPELDLDAKYRGKTAEDWAAHMHHFQLALAIAQERARRARWSALRSAWIAATIATATSSIAHALSEH